MRKCVLFNMRTTNAKKRKKKGHTCLPSPELMSRSTANKHHFKDSRTVREFGKSNNAYEPRYDKTNKMSVRPAKSQISLGIRPVWSESSLSARRKLGSLATHWAHSEDSDQFGRMPRLIWVFARRTLTLLVLSCRGSYAQSDNNASAAQQTFFPRPGNGLMRQGVDSCQFTLNYMSRLTTKQQNDCAPSEDSDQPVHSMGS